MGPGGYLYAARSFRALSRYAPGGGSAATLWLTFPVGTLISDIDFDQDGMLWGGGNNTNIFRVQPDKTITSYPFAGNVRSLRVFGGYLYVAANTTAGEQIWRAPISSGGLGTPEVYFDFAGAYPGVTPLAITFSSDGVLYIGTNSPNGLVVVEPGKTHGTPFSAYQALFGAGLRSLAWGKTDDLYASTSSGVILKFTVRGKVTAPYYGSTL
jgi:hypothetical protein